MATACVRRGRRRRKSEVRTRSRNGAGVVARAGPQRWLGTCRILRLRHDTGASAGEMAKAKPKEFPVALLRKQVADRDREIASLKAKLAKADDGSLLSSSLFRHQVHRTPFAPASIRSHPAKKNASHRTRHCGRPFAPAQPADLNGARRHRHGVCCLDLRVSR